MLDVCVANTVINQMSSLLTSNSLDEMLSLPLKDLAHETPLLLIPPC